jgi:acyl-CoA synthetase (AMP-forming)/AMP-acid ligase II
LEKTASICGAARLSFQQLEGRVNRLSSALSRLGLGKGDSVAVLALNCHRYLELYYGVPQLGAAIVPINFRLPAQEVKYIIDHAGARGRSRGGARAPAFKRAPDAGIGRALHLYQRCSS